MAALTPLVLVTLAIATPRALADPGWITSCQFSHSAQDDPIVFPGQAGAAHLHDFVAAQTTNADSTPDSLRAGGTSCRMAGDTSAYWAPAAYEDGLRVGFGTSKHALFYYRRKAAPSGITVAPFPDGLKLVPGNAHATSAEDNPGIASGNITFKCGPGSGTETPYPPLACSSGIMVAVFILPNCWDGFQLDSPDHFSHMAYPTASLCPPSHPIVVPRIQGFWRYDVGVDPIDLSLASGGWWTVHTDFFNAWNPLDLQWLLDNCINANQDCGTDPAVPPVAAAAPVITSDGGGDSASLSVSENQTAVTDVDATDPDVGDTLTYSITGGADVAAFTIDASTGVLMFTTAPDFEARGDANTDNVYEVMVSASDGSLSDSQSLAVTVTDLVEGGNQFPQITSDGGGATASLSVGENSTVVTDVDADDPDPDTLTYSIAGTDVLAFTIAPSTGVLSFLSAPNFELPTDSDLNNVYDVTVTVSDGNGGSDSQALAVTVTNVDEGSGSPLYFSLTDVATVGTVTAENEDVVHFDGTNFTLAFDGSDVGLGGFRIDAFSWVDATHLLLSFDGPGTVPPIAGTTDDSDVVLFTATSLGSMTAGTFEMYFDGSDVGLTTSGEDVDAVELLPGGNLLISTLNTVGVTGAAGEDEDLLRFVPTSLGLTTAGTFSLYFDGSGVGLAASSEDIDAAAVDASGKIYLSTFGNFSVTGVSGADEDVFVFTPTSLGLITSGSYSPTLYFDGSAFGLSANDVFAIDLP